MNIFLLGSIYGKSHSQNAYQLIADEVKAQGHTIQADLILNSTPEEMASWSNDQHIAFHRQITEGIKKADAIFAEVSYPSTSVGYLMSIALQSNKPTVVFYSGTQEPHLFRALEKATDKLQVARYSDIGELRQEVRYGLEFVATSQDVRFNFFISPQLSTYMDWIARHHKVPRSVYLRQLIDDDMSRHGEYDEV